MSYILDALKKIDHEKNKRSSGGRINISGDLFRERARPVISVGLWKIALLLVAVALIACGATLFVMRGSSNNKSAAPPQIVPAPVVTSPITVHPVSIPATPAASPEHADMLVAAPHEKSRNIRRNKEQIPSRIQSVQMVAVPADIKLSGIAWQEERAERRAVINGFLLKEGGVVSGAKITDIQADKVYFSSSTGAFQIKLDAVLPVEVKR